VALQTPATQNPDVHCAFAVQSEPFGASGRQMPAWQKVPAMQSASTAQLLRQVAPPPAHVNGAHDTTTGGRHVPAPSQLRADVAVVPRQDPAEQIVAGP
jgi:hypothetical protein